MTSGSKNLVILGVASVIIAAATTSVALALYHNSGDIYLDRSRPGYLPEKEEVEEDVVEEEYTFEKSGPVTEEIIDEYLEKLDIEIRAVEMIEKPFDASALSNEKLGIPEE